MHCPICSTTLIPFEEQGIHLDRCLEGHGIWFDRGELNSYRKKQVKNKNSSREEIQKFQPIPGMPVKNCPRCTTETLEAGRLRELDVHHCHTCHGVFLSPLKTSIQESHDSIGVETGIEIGATVFEIIISAFG